MNSTSLAAVLMATPLALSLTGWVERVVTPDVPFSQQAPPPAPDYGDPASWSALPERGDTADQVPAGEGPIDQRAAPVDVFYIHPTSYVRDHWNAPTTDVALNEATDEVATGIQASAFNACCAVYAPRYRQANGTAFYHPSADGEAAISLAYEDVRRAFDAFNQRRGEGRPFILASHSQGTVMAERLLYEAVVGTPLEGRLVAAYLIGGRVTLAGLAARAPGLPPCAAPGDVRCVVAWNARSPTFTTSPFELAREDRSELLCTNPLSWRVDGAYAPASLNLGAVFLESDDPSPRPAYADARCEGGILRADLYARPPRDLPSRILDRTLGEGNHHPIEYQIYFMNLRQNAVERVRAWGQGGERRAYGQQPQ